MKSNTILRVSFIIGSPRSGTTILENILNCHQEIAEWYEPYYLWERFFPAEENDEWGNRKIDPKVIKKIHDEFFIFSKKSKKSIVLDKLPTHAFNIPTIHKIFPHAKWIHIIRDGRDVTLSIRKEWNKRQQIVEEKNVLKLFRVATTMLKRQPFWRYRIMAIISELASNTFISPSNFFNKSRWKGKVGWGPRFHQWKEYLERHTPIEFNAMQWVKSVEAVRKTWSILPEKNKIEIRYEDLLQFPEKTLKKILNILELDACVDFFESIPRLNTHNTSKWKAEFTSEELDKIRPILSPLIQELGYGKKNEW